MKPIQSIRLTDIRSFTLFAIVAVVLSSCARKVVFQSSPIVPAATGTVKMKRDNNNNYALTIRVRNLADPGQLNPPKKYYIVWMESEYNGVKNLGQLRSSTGFLSKKLKAELNAVTPFRPRSVFITAEFETQIQYPGPDVVLRSNTFR